MYSPVCTKVFKIREPKGSLRAFATVKIGPIHINGCRLIIQDGKTGWVSMPQEEVKEPKEGEKKYRNIVYVEDKSLCAAIDKAVLAEYSKEETATSVTNVTPAAMPSDGVPF